MKLHNENKIDSIKFSTFLLSPKILQNISSFLDFWEKSFSFYLINKNFRSLMPLPRVDESKVNSNVLESLLIDKSTYHLIAEYFSYRIATYQAAYQHQIETKVESHMMQQTLKKCGFFALTGATVGVIPYFSIVIHRLLSSVGALHKQYRANYNLCDEWFEKNVGHFQDLEGGYF